MNDGAGGLEATQAALGAYGLRVSGLAPGAQALLVRAHPDWPEVNLSATIGRAASSLDLLGDDQARLRLRNGGEIEIDRAPGTALLRTPTRLDVQELVHPYLAPIAAVFAHWAGRDSFHAGAFVVDDGVWAVVGEREAGKSTTLARLAQLGVPVVCDDMLVLDGQLAFTGPRVLDLRREAAERLGLGEGLGVVGARERWRLRLDDAPDGLPLRGWVFLAWGDSIEVDRISAPARLSRIAVQRGLRVPPPNPATMLDHAALPGVELTRPRELGSLPEAADRLLEALSA